MKNISKLFLLIIALFFAIPILSILNSRHLVFDSSSFIYTLLQHEVLQNVWFRPISNLFFFPLLWFVQLFNQYEITRLVSVTYGMVSLFSIIGSLLTTYFMTRKQNKLEYLIFPLVCFSIATSQALPWLCLNTHEIAMIAWPLFFLIYFYPTEKKYFLFQFLILLALGLTHESALVLLGLLILIYATRYRQTKIKNYLYLSLLSAGLSLGCLLRSHYGPYPTVVEYSVIAQNPFILFKDHYLVWQCTLAALFLIGLLIKNFSLKYGLSLLSISIILLLLFRINPSSTLDLIRSARVSQLLLTFSIFVVFIAVINYQNLQNQFLNKTKQQFFILLFAVSSFVFIYRELDLNKQWGNFLITYKNYMQSQPLTCFTNPPVDILPSHIKSSIVPFYFFSMLIQENKNIKHIHAAENKNLDACQKILENKKALIFGPDPKYFIVINFDEPNSYFNFNYLFTK